MPRIIGKTICKKTLALFLIGQAATSAWSVNNTYINTTNLNQQMITATNNVLVVGATGNLNCPDNNVIYLDKTAPGGNNIVNDNVATVSPPIPANSIGVAIVVQSGGQINAPNNFLAINANAENAGGNIFINNAGTISSANNENVIFTGNNVNTNLMNSGTIKGAIDVMRGDLHNSGDISAVGGHITSVNLVNSNIGKIDVKNITSKAGTITNNGYLNVQAGGTVSDEALAFINNGTIVTAGTINSPITFGNNNATLMIKGGAINKVTGGTGQDVININTSSAFNINQAINNINTINVQGTTPLTIKAKITGVTDSFMTAAGSTTTFSTGSDLSGGGTINNLGTIIIKNDGAIGEDLPMGDLINIGNITLNGKINIIGDLSNSGNIEPDGGEITSVNLTNSNIGKIDVKNITSNAGTITNNGYLNVQAGGTVSDTALAFINNGTIVTAGTINSPITFGNNNATLMIKGGAINKVTGGTGEDGININTSSAFNINQAINNINTINVQGTTPLTIKAKMTGVTDSFTTAAGSTTTFSTGSDLSGGGIINNLGEIILKNNGTIGAEVRMGDLINYGTITTNTGSDVKVGAIINKTNSKMTITSKVTTNPNATNVINNAGTLRIDAGGNLFSPILGVILVNSGTLALLNSGKMMADAGAKLGNVSNTGTIEINNTDGLKIYGSLTNNHLKSIPAQLNVITSTVLVGDINNISGAIKIGVDTDFTSTPDISSISYDSPSILTNAANQTIDVVGKGTIGQHKTTLAGSVVKRHVLGAVNNSGIVTINTAANIPDGDVKVGDFNNNAANAQLNITKGIVKTGNINNLGTIKIGDAEGAGGDLSTSDTGKILTNSGIINILGAGTIGNHGTLRDIINNGLINAFGGDININGDFINKLNSSELNITKGIVKTGNISNLGTITISDIDGIRRGDLSVIDNDKTLTNSGIINVLGTATIGDNGALGDIINNGLINAAGGNIIIDGKFTNNLNNAKLNITKGIVKTGNINNNLGTITIGNNTDLTNTPDISSISYDNPSTLINAANQTIEVVGKGTIGQHTTTLLGGVVKRHVLGAVHNSGIITINTAANIPDGDVKIGDFNNNGTNAQLNITKGVVITGDINNNLGTITIIGDGLEVGVGPDLSGSPAKIITLTNAARQKIIIDRGGSMGKKARLGEITNYGIIKFNAEFDDTQDSAPIDQAFFNAGKFINKVGAQTIINNVNSAVNSVLLSGVENFGMFSVNNTQNKDKVILGAITNKAGGIFNINGPVTAKGDFTNDNGGIVNLGANIDIGTDGAVLNPVSNTFTNKGTVNMLRSVTIPNGNYTLDTNGLHVLTIDNGLPQVLTLKYGKVTINAGSSIQINTTGEKFIFKNNVPIGDIFIGTGAAGLDDNVKIIGNTDLVSFTIDTVDTNRIQLISHCKPITSILGSVNDYADSSNKAQTIQSFGGALDKLVNQGADSELAELLYNLQILPSTEAVKDAVHGLMPDNSDLVPINFDGSSQVINGIETRLDQIARTEINNIYIGNSGYAAGDMQNNDGLWIKALGGSNLQKSQDTVPGYNANSYGTAFGLDGRILADTWLGFSGSVIGTNVKTKDTLSKRTSITSYQGTVYASVTKEKYYIDGFVGMALNAYKKSRRMQYADFAQTATAKFFGWQPTFKIAAGHIHQADIFRLIPNVSLQYSVLKQRAYKEMGAGNAGFKVDAADFTQLEAGVGFKIAIFYQAQEDLIFNPDLHFMLLHDFKSQTEGTVAEFIGGGGKFVIPGAGGNSNKNTYNIGGGLTVIRDDRLHITGNYDLKIKNKFIGHSGSLRIRYEL